MTEIADDIAALSKAIEQSVPRPSGFMLRVGDLGYVIGAEMIAVAQHDGCTLRDPTFEEFDALCEALGIRTESDVAVITERRDGG